MTRTMTVVLAVILVAALAAGCRGKQEAAPGEQEKQPARLIGISVLTMGNPFFVDIIENARAEAARHGYELIAVSGEFDAPTQYQQVKDFIVKKVSAIILTPCDSKGVGTAIQEANAAGIPVFTADIACLADGAKVVSHVASNNYTGGRLAAKAMMEALGNKGKVAIIDHPEVESVIQRTKGFRDELKDAKSPIEIVKVLAGGGKKEKALPVAQEILTTHGDLNGIFAINDPSALAAVAAIEIARKTGQIVVIGFDGQPEGKKAILEGKIHADPIQFPDQIGRKTVQTIMKHLNGEKVPAEILIPTRLYYKADAEKDPSLTKSE